MTNKSLPFAQGFNLLDTTTRFDPKTRYANPESRTAETPITIDGHRFKYHWEFKKDGSSLLLVVGFRTAAIMHFSLRLNKNSMYAPPPHYKDPYVVLMKVWNARSENLLRVMSRVSGRKGKPRHARLIPAKIAENIIHSGIRHGIFDQDGNITRPELLEGNASYGAFKLDGTGPVMGHLQARMQRYFPSLTPV
jgi:hypothetical protein